MKRVIFLVVLAFVLGFAGESLADESTATEPFDEGIVTHIVVPTDDLDLPVPELSATPELDQESPFGSILLNGSDTDVTWQQEVTVGLAGKLTGVEIYITLPGSADFLINVGIPWQSDTHDFETVVSSPTPGWVFIDTSPANINLDVGDKFVIGIHGRGGGLWFGGSWKPGEYERGELWVNEDMRDPDQYDMAFRTFMGLPDVSGCINLQGLPLANRRVILRQKGEPKQSTRTDANGCYEFESVVSGKKFKIIIKGPVVP